MPAVVECMCWGDPKSSTLAGHDYWCPIKTRIPFCEDCARIYCVCEEQFDEC